MSSDGKKDPVMPAYGRDFYSDEAVILMSLEQEAIYWRLLVHAWHEGSIPSDIPSIAAIVASKISGRRFATIWPGIAPKWTPSSELAGRLVNKRQEHERRERRERARKLSENGRAGNEARWGDRQAIARGSQPSDRNAIPFPPTTSVGGSEGAAPKPDPDQSSADAIRVCLLELGVLRLSPKKLSVLVDKISASGWHTSDLRRLAEQVKGKAPAQRSARLAGLLQDDENRDVAIRASAASGPTLSMTHPQNMPLGVASCGCAECVKFRAKRNGGAA